ncbi:restriction endonuclease subunit S [Prevotella copri]|nr:restriction endonuclease subunit S [Segatella copri]MCW4414265.1 restriction endonuclease subunit S [Segatella copri]
MSSYYEKILATGEVKCIDEEIPFEIPQGWKWCRLKHICSMQAGKNISASRIFSDKTELHPYRCVGGNGLRGYTGEFNTQGHYSIVGRQGALCGCVNIEKGKFYATEHAVVVDTYEILSPLFMYYFLMALNLNKYATATAQPGLAVSNVLEVMCPLPPLNEGERIIKKLALLIPLVENYNAIQEKQNALNSSIKERLKKSILQEAIQGKLVPQIAEEGTAQELLEQIKAEKQNLVKEGKLKKSALATSVIFRGDDNRYYEKIGKKCLDITDEIPFDIPENWQWIKLDQGISLLSGRDLEPSQYNDLHHGIPYITGASNFVNSNLIIN